MKSLKFLSVSLYMLAGADLSNVISANHSWIPKGIFAAAAILEICLAYILQRIYEMKLAEAKS